MSPLIIPHAQLSPEALDGVIQEFVTRDGTDYGEKEVDLTTKKQQVLDQLKAGRAVIVFDPASESCNILESCDPAVKKLGQGGDGHPG